MTYTKRLNSHFDVTQRQMSSHGWVQTTTTQRTTDAKRNGIKFPFSPTRSRIYPKNEAGGPETRRRPSPIAVRHCAARGAVGPRTAETPHRMSPRRQSAISGGEGGGGGGRAQLQEARRAAGARQVAAGSGTLGARAMGDGGRLRWRFGPRR